MTWIHQCHVPAWWRIKLMRRTSGARWRCRCGKLWRLQRRSIIPHHSHWEWQEA